MSSKRAGVVLTNWKRLLGERLREKIRWKLSKTSDYLKHTYL
jgi:hypothetical protein